MKGLIIHTDEKKIIIRAEDERKFDVSQNEVKSELSPKVGDSVDFDIRDGIANEVYILRQSANLDESLDKAKSVAGNLYNEVAGSINEQNLKKAKDIASQTATKAKGAIQSVSLPSTFNVYNKFTLLIVVTMFVSMFLPMVRIFGVSQNYFELVEGGSLQVIFLLLTGASLVIGLPRIVTRVLSVICLITVCSPIYDGIAFLQEMDQFSRSSGFSVKDLLKLLKPLNVGFYALTASTLLFAIMQFLPMYQANRKLVFSGNPVI